MELPDKIPIGMVGVGTLVLGQVEPRYKNEHCLVK